MVYIIQCLASEMLAIGKEKSMKKQLGKVPYEEAKLDVVLLDSLDIITTSVTMGDGEDRDDGAWT